MMMDCPRCGFNQPKDRFCASCGLNIDLFLAKPVPLWKRTLQNPNFHLSLIGILIAVVVGWIVYTQSALVSREVGQLLDLPVSSKNAADPEKPERQLHPLPAAATAPQPAAGEIDQQETTELQSEAARVASQEKTEATVADPTSLELSFWEVPREALVALLGTANRIAEGSGGRAYYLIGDQKFADAIAAQGQRLSPLRKTSLQTTAPLLVQSPAAEAFQFDMALQPVKSEKEFAVRFEISLLLPTNDSFMEAAFGGIHSVTPQGVLVLVIEPPLRTVKEEVLTKAGEGPWSIYASPEFRNGLTEWVALIQLK